MPRLSRLYLYVAAAAVAVYPMIGVESVREWYAAAAAAGGVAAVWVGSVVNRRGGLWPWLLIAVGETCWFVADVGWNYFTYVSGADPFPSVLDAVYLAGYPIITIGVLGLVRRSGTGRADRAAMVDAAIVTVGAGLVMWVFVVVPSAEAGGSTLLERAVAGAYPVGDVLLLAVSARLLLVPGRRPPAFGMLAASLALVLAADVIFFTNTAELPVVMLVQNVGYLVAYLLMGAAAVHPSARERIVPPEDAPAGGMAWRRMALLASASLLAPGVLVVVSLRVAFIPGLPIGMAAGALFLLVVLRMSGLLDQVKRQAQLLSTMARTDALTGTLNRRALDQDLPLELERADRSGEPLSVVMVDLDHFKAFNDENGHQAGDALLHDAAQAWRKVLRGSDVLARYGGEEFLVTLPGCAGAEAAAKADLLRARMPERTTCSAGVAEWDHAENPDQLLRRADHALYSAKDSGRNRSVLIGTRSIPEYEDSLVGGDPEATFEHQLATAVANGQVVLHYQPVISLPDQRCVGVEALVRWNHPDRGLLYPAAFIDVAERTGDIVGIGTFVLHQACADAAIWRSAVPAAGLRVHVNVSARQLTDPGFIDVVNACLAEHALPPDQLVLELTESVLLSSPEAIHRLHTLADLGVLIAIDDFGTGYASLSTLRSLPTGMVKVDKSFVASAMTHSEDRTVIESVVDMAARLGLDTVAEGVEYLDQQDFLTQAGAGAVQGFLYQRPVPAAQFTEWLRTHHPERPPTIPAPRSAGGRAGVAADTARRG